MCVSVCVCLCRYIYNRINCWHRTVEQAGINIHLIPPK